MATRRTTSSNSSALHGDDASGGPVPPENEPGHHPSMEQDKPIGRRPRPRATPDDDSTRRSQTEARFGFSFSGPAGVAGHAFVLSEDRAYVGIADGMVTARYGAWVVNSPLANIAEACMTGPYKLWKVAGPPRLSFVDRGITFATNTERGVCIKFHEPVPGIEPTGRVLHPNLTVTVAEPERLVAALTNRVV